MSDGVRILFVGDVVGSAGRRTLLRGVALGVCAGALVAGIGVSHTHVGITHRPFVHVVPHRGFGPGQGEPRPLPVPPPPPAAVS